MWGQVSLKKALKGYLTGRTVKAVDLSAEVVRDLSEVMEALSDGVVFFAETVAVENIEFREEVEDMVKEDTVMEPEPKKKKPHTHKTLEQTEAEWANRKITDLPKLHALCKAGWKVKDLADEFKCSEQTVRNTMKREGIA